MKIVKEIDKSLSKEEIKEVIKYLKISYIDLNRVIDLQVEGGFIYMTNEENREKLKKIRKLTSILIENEFHISSKDELIELLQIILKNKYGNELELLLKEKKEKIKELEKENKNLKNEIENLKKEMEKFLFKEDDMTSMIQQKIAEKIQKYEEKIKKLEKENRELKEQLGYYE
jgi:chromosome segregation ATPase